MQNSAAPPTPPTRPPWVVWAGLAVVLAAAAVLSFDALRSLAVAVSIPDRFAWLLPIAVDAGAAVSCATWLGGRTTATAARFAGRMTWALLAVTVLGNAAALGMHAHGVVPPWWVAVLVGSIPPAVVGSVVHLVVLLVRGTEADRTAGPIGLDEADQDDAGEWIDPWDRWAAPALVPLATAGDTSHQDDHQDHQDDHQDDPQEDDELTARARALVAAGAGRPRLVKELGVTDHQARQLLAQLRALDRRTA